MSAKKAKSLKTKKEEEKQEKVFRTYKKEYCQMLIDHMSKGLSYESFAADIKCGHSTLYDWETRYPEFGEAKKQGFDAAFKFWEGLLTAKAYGLKKDIDATCVIFCLKTRFHKHYGEHRRVELSGEVTNVQRQDLSKLSDKELRTLESIMGKVSEEEEND
jgi:hypothetical protein